MLDTYDILLAAIPASGISVGGLLHLAGLDSIVTVPVAATVAGLFVVYAMFGDPPRGPAFGPHQ